MGCAHHGAVVRRREVVLGSWVAMDTVGELDRRTSVPLVGGAAQRPAHLRSRSLLDFDLNSPTVSISTQRPIAVVHLLTARAAGGTDRRLTQAGSVDDDGRPVLAYATQDESGTRKA